MNIEYPENEFNKETNNEVYFYTPKFYVFDNFSPFVIKIWGKEFMTSEHAYQWKKYENLYPDIAKQIFEAKSPNDAKKIADANKDKLTDEWHKIKVSIMEEILTAKTNQHEKVKRMLIETANKTIIENSPVDNFWGIGPDGNGQNMVGKIYMKLRDDLV